MLGDILYQIFSTSSKNAKIELVREHLFDDPLYRKVVEYTYNSLATYGYKPDDEIIEDIIANEFADIKEPTEDMFILLDKLKTRRLVGIDAKLEIDDIGYDNKLIYLILSRSLSIGVGNKSLSYIGFKLDKFSPMLATDKAKYYLPVIAQEKYDGVRILFNLNTREFFTRNGRKFTNKTLSDQLPSEPPEHHEPLFLDGEFILESGTQADRQKISGIVNHILSAQEAAAIPDNIRYMVFDYVPVSSFVDNTPYKEPYMQRVYNLGIWENYKSNLLRIAPHRFCIEQSDIDRYYREVIDREGEGLVIKDRQGWYEHKRSTSWVKLKATYDITLTVTGWEYGTGKYAGMLGALICEGETHDGQKVSCKVGSGLCDDERLAPSDREWIGQRVDVLYNTLVTSDGRDTLSLFLPRFKGVRYDT
jgi:hypothetical protein